MTRLLLAAVMALGAVGASPSQTTYVTPDGSLSIRYPSNATLQAGWPSETAIVSPLVEPSSGRELVDGEWRVAVSIDQGTTERNLGALVRNDCREETEPARYLPVYCRIVTVKGRSWTWVTRRFCSELCGTDRILRTVFANKVYTATSLVPDGNHVDEGLAITKQILMTLTVGKDLPRTGPPSLPLAVGVAMSSGLVGVLLRRMSDVPLWLWKRRR